MRIVVPSRDVPKQVSRYCHLGHLESGVARPWLPTFAPISTSFSRNVVGDLCSTFFGKANVRMKLAKL